MRPWPGADGLNRSVSPRGLQIVNVNDRAGLRQLGTGFLVGLGLVDGILGATIAYGTFEAQQAGLLRDGIARTGASIFGGVGPSITHLWPLIWLPAFCGTLALLPILLAYLVRQQAAPPVRYWGRASAAGVGFGLAACAATGFFTPIFLAISALPWQDVQGLRWLVVLLVGPALFAVTSAIVLPRLYFVTIIATGITFGLMNAMIVRWRLATPQQLHRP